MKNRYKMVLVISAGALLVAYLSVVTPKAVHAAIAALVQDIDQPARAPFLTTVLLNGPTSTFTPVTVPTVQRLVVDYVSISGKAASAGGNIQPIVILEAKVAGTIGDYYFYPSQSNPAPTAFSLSQQTTIFADSLSVASPFAGSAPSTHSFRRGDLGHLINNP